MKAIKIIILFLMFAIVLTFAYQNLEKVNVTFINWIITVPFSLTIFLSFSIGVIIGGVVIFSSRKKKKDNNCEDQSETKYDNKENSEF
jgi:uncharacterized integral membrane protein